MEGSEINGLKNAIGQLIQSIFDEKMNDIEQTLDSKIDCISGVLTQINETLENNTKEQKKYIDEQIDIKIGTLLDEIERAKKEIVNQIDSKLTNIQLNQNQIQVNNNINNEQNEQKDQIGVNISVDINEDKKSLDDGNSINGGADENSKPTKNEQFICDNNDSYEKPSTESNHNKQEENITDDINKNQENPPIDININNNNEYDNDSNLKNQIDGTLDAFIEKNDIETIKKSEIVNRTKFLLINVKNTGTLSWPKNTYLKDPDDNIITFDPVLINKGFECPPNSSYQIKIKLYTNDLDELNDSSNFSISLQIENNDQNIGSDECQDILLEDDEPNIYDTIVPSIPKGYIQNFNLKLNWDFAKKNYSTVNLNHNEFLTLNNKPKDVFLKLVNNGNNEWPEGTYLVIDKDSSNSYLDFENVLVNNGKKVLPKEEVDISIKLFSTVNPNSVNTDKNNKTLLNINLFNKTKSITSQSKTLTINIIKFNVTKIAPHYKIEQKNKLVMSPEDYIAGKDLSLIFKITNDGNVPLPAKSKLVNINDGEDNSYNNFLCEEKLINNGESLQSGSEIETCLIVKPSNKEFSYKNGDVITLCFTLMNELNQRIAECEGKFIIDVSKELSEEQINDALNAIEQKYNVSGLCNADELREQVIKNGGDIEMVMKSMFGNF